MIAAPSRLATVLALTLAAPAARSNTGAAGLTQLAWLAGCWEGGSGERRRDEVWTQLAGDTMLGVGRLVRSGKTVEYEFMRLHVEEGTVVYTAKPSGQPEDSFKLVSWKDGTATFENPAHDFPQRVLYQRKPDGSLLARIEGTDKGQQRGVDFPFRRVPCPGG
jgi:hypothetical protein